MMSLPVKYAIVVVLLLLFFHRTPADWEQTGGPGGGRVDVLAVSGTTIIANTFTGGIYISTNYGESWTAGNTGLAMHSNVYDLAVSEGKVFAATSDGLYHSTENGRSWIKTDLDLLPVRFLAVNSETILAGDSRFIALSPDKGESWTTDTLRLEAVCCFAVVGGVIIAGSQQIYLLGRSMDNGASWIIDDSLPWNHTFGLRVIDKTVFACTDSGVFRSNDNGVSWAAVNTGLTNTWVYALFKTGDTLFATTRRGESSGLFLSADKGDSWTAAVNNGLENASIESFVKSGDMLFAGTTGGVFRSADNGTSWTAVNNGLANTYVSGLAVNSNTIFAMYAGIYRSTNNGASWTSVYADDSINITCLAACSGTIFAGNYYYDASTDRMLSKGVLRSTDNGESWTRITAGLPGSYIRSLACRGDTVFAGTCGEGVFRSTDNGTSWTAAGLPGSCIETLAMGNGKLFADVGHGYFSADNGVSWTAVVPRFCMDHIAVHGDKIFAGNGNSNAFSADNGSTWTTYNEPFTTYTAVFDTDGDKIFIGSSGGVFLSMDYGQSWTEVNEGMRSLSVPSLAVKGDTLFAGTSNDGVLRRSISEMISLTRSQKQKNTPRRKRTCVFRCSPSGFLVSYAVGSRCPVRMEMFTISGERAALRDMGEQSPGEYRVRFADAGITAGVYVFRFQAGNYLESALVKAVK